MDNFSVEIDVQSYLTNVDGRRVYRRGKTWSFAVGRDLSVAQIKAAVEEQFQWSTDQRMTIWYGSGHDTVPLISKSEIAELFDRCNESRTLRFGVTIESKNNESANVRGDEQNDEPVHAPFFAWPNQAYAGEYEDDEPMQYEEEEEEKPVHVKAPENEPAAIRVPLGTLDVDNSYDEQNVPGDDEGIIANNVVPTHIHDRNCPQIQEKSTFVDGKTFKVALRQLAIREEWSFNTEYSDKERFRAICSDEDCPWRIHASKLKGCNTFMVKKLPFAHTCGSANKSDKKKGKARMANKDWIADRGKAIMQEEVTLSAKGLKEQLEKEFNMKLEYTNVWKGRARALAALNGTYQEMVMQMRGKRRKVADGLQGTIVPSVVKELNQKSKGLRYGEVRATPTIAEISGNGWRHTVDLGKKECSCRRWQIGGKPCTHALHFIFSRGEKVDQYVDDCFSVAKFKAAYEPILMPIRGQSQWPKAQPDFEMIPPKLSRSAGRPRTRRYKNSSEGGTGRKHVCKRCGATGHLLKTCKEPEKDSDADRDATPLPKRQKTNKTATTTTTHPCTPTKQVSQPSIATSSPMTRSMAAAMENASSPPSASTRSKSTTNSPLKQV